MNDTGRNFRLVSVPVTDPSEHNWDELIPHRPDVMLEGCEVFAAHYVVLERQAGLPQIRVTHFDSGRSHPIPFPESVYDAGQATNREWESDTYRYYYESLTTPLSIYDHDVTQRTDTLLKRTPVLGDYDPEDYVSERLEAAAADGTAVPVSLVYRRGRTRDRQSPLLLIAYGSYAIPYPVSFSSNRLSLLDRGFGIAIAHVRGGGDLGRPWHDQGRMMAKMNTFTDFITAAEHLVERGYTSSRGLVIEGGSAGGLLMGAVVNMRPDLFRAVVMQVPFLDVLNTMSDPSLPLTVSEYEEWGNPEVKSTTRLHPRVRSLYQPLAGILSSAAGQVIVQRQSSDVLGTSEIHRQAPDIEDRSKPTAPDHQHGRWTQRCLRSVRPAQGDRVGLRVHAGLGRHSRVTGLGGYAPNALNPVIACPRMSVWTSWVPS